MNMQPSLCRKADVQLKQYRLAAAVVVGLCLAAIPGTGSADTTAFSDRKETGSRLDFSKTLQGHSGDSVKHQLTMYERWGRKHLRDQNNRIDFSFNTDDDKRFERVLLIDADPDGGLKGEMRDWGTNEWVGDVPLARKNRRTVQATIPVEMLGDNVSTYQWVVSSLYHAPDHGPCGIPSDVFVCVDRFPERGRVTHNL